MSVGRAIHISLFDAGSIRPMSTLCRINRLISRLFDGDHGWNEAIKVDLSRQRSMRTKRILFKVHIPRATKRDNRASKLTYSGGLRDQRH
jgi:hypothetical protein